MALPPTTDWLRVAGRTAPDRPALATSGRTLTYRQLDTLVDRTAATLVTDLELRPAARLGVLAATEDRLDTVVLLWAIWRLGAVAVVLDPAEPALASDPGSLQAKWGLTDVVAAVAGSVTPTRTAEPPARDGRRHHTWVPTSGTTTLPRLAVITHANVAASVSSAHRRLGNGPEDRWLLALPLFHVGGLSILWRSAAAGGTVVLHDRFDAAEVAKAMAGGDVSIASLVPTMLSRILDVDSGPYSGLRSVLLGGAATPPELVERAIAAGLPVHATYGMTETCSQVATVAPGHEADSIASVGRPLDGFDVRIDGHGADGVGEIVVSGPAVSPGYAGETERSGPLRTGDVGRFDAAGRLVVVGRRDHVIVTGGENVNPGAVEAVLTTHPDIAEAAVHGVPDAEWGEVVVATIVVRSAVPSTEELDSFARRSLAPAQRPRRWTIVDRIPHLATGKIDRVRLAEERAKGE
jgi:O-succinylbenzoic acid--CoA ligase